jgi:hypothetical protein
MRWWKEQFYVPENKAFSCELTVTRMPSAVARARSEPLWLANVHAHQ